MNPIKKRPELRELFFVSNKRVNVVFHTSNTSKYLQARAVFSRFELSVDHFRGHTEPYSEEYNEGKETLLENAIKEVLSTLGRNSVFFVEDTSLRIDALSTNEDYPGLSVKEWFTTTSFEELDKQLIAKNNGRKATVKSDIALHLPGLKRPILFHGETTGEVAPTKPEFEESTQYPWLTPNTFNGWFIPDGTTKRLGEMSFEESWSYDFRVCAFVELIDRIEEYTAALNLPVQAYTRTDRKEPTGQMSLLPDARTVVLAIGKTCAGKSTFGEYAEQQHNFRWIEASNVVRMLQADEGSNNQPKETIQQFSQRLLTEHGFDLIARKILQITTSHRDLPLVVTGFRTLEEIEAIIEEVPATRIIFIEATERTRFERYLARAREGSVRKLADFKDIDETQWGFGLLRVCEDFSDIKIVNEGSFEGFHAQIDASITGKDIKGTHGVTTHVYSPRVSKESQLYRCLLALNKNGKALDCRSIQDLTTESGPPIRFNNVNKMLKRYPELAKRLEASGDNVRYKITDAGRTYLRLLDNRIKTTDRDTFNQADE